MRKAVTTRRAGPGLTGQDWWNAFELRWVRPASTILAAPAGPWGATWAAIPERRVPFLEPAPPDPWFRVRHEGPAEESPLYGPLSWHSRLSAGETVVVYKLGWPTGGIFVPAEESPPRPYHPLPVAAEILVDAQGVASDDPAALLGFVNRWGRLGVGLPGAEDFGADGVQQTGEGLRELTRWMRVLYAFQHGKATTATGADLADMFQTRLGGVHLSARPTRVGLRPVFPLRRLLDALYLELWGVATEAKRLRQCPRCQHCFIRGREDQIFCTGRCARLWHVKRWKQRARQQRRRRRHPQEGR
ncbi:MAG TPA: hypothetical protein VJX92_09685 [Methylomirabilota bacterium]|nr:hypothetical protein [Methylomirabilota bacterium]